MNTTNLLLGLIITTAVFTLIRIAEKKAEGTLEDLTEEEREWLTGESTRPNPDNTLSRKSGVSKYKDIDKPKR